MPTLYDSVAVGLLHDIATYKTTQTTNEVDTAGYESILFLITTGTATDGGYAFTLEHSDAANDGYEAVPATFIQGDLPTTDTDSDDMLFVVGYRGPRRYVRVKATVSGSPSTGTVFGVHYARGGHYTLPVEQD